MPITDHFSDYQSGLSAPVSGGFDISPDDANDLTILPRAIMVANGGDLGVVLMDGTTIILPALSAGQLYPIRIRRVFTGIGGTTATGIVGLY